MKKSNPWKPLIGVLCVLALIFAVAVALVLDSRSPNPIFGILRPEPTEPTEPTGVTEPEETTIPEASEEPMPYPEDLPPVVQLPTEPTGISFPCQIPGYDLVVEKIAPYSGMFVEDGSNSDVENVAMLMIRNNGDYPLEYTQICVDYEGETLLFDFSALPAGASLVVQEKNRKPMPEENAKAATAMVVRRAEMEMSADKVRVTDNGDNTLTIENLTDHTIPTVRVFYKYYMEGEGVFVGGIAFTVRITRLGAGAKVTVQPSHYTSKTGRVVMVLTYDSEV